MLRKFLFPIILIIAFGSSSKAQDEDLLLVSTIPAELKVKSNAVVRYDDKLIKIPDLKSLNETYTRVITVLNKEGDRNVDALIHYDENTVIKKLGAIVYNQYGKEIHKFRKSDFEDVSAVSDFSLYEDNRIKYLRFTPTEYPYTVKFFYDISSFNTAALPSWYPLEGYYISTQKSKFKVLYNSEVGLKRKAYNLDGYDVINTVEEGVLVYEAQNIHAIKPEAFSPRFVGFAPHVKITPKKFFYEGYTGYSDDWSSLGKWMYDELLIGRTQLSEVTISEIKTLVVGVDDPIEKAKMVYKYMQDRTRYISVQEGIGGIQPIVASKVDEVKYGDCKGLTNYTKALMDAAGVKSNYSRVYASRKNTVDVDEDFVSFLGQTNHVILNIPNGEENLWLECTSQTTPFNYIANFTDDRDVFVITPEGGKIVHTTAYKTEDNIQTTKSVVILAADGSIQGKVDIETKGYQYALA